VLVQVWASGDVLTILDGRWRIPAAPMDAPEYAAMAEDLGYGADLARMCAEHEAMHSYLSARLGGERSPTLLHVAGGADVPEANRLAEESLVLEAQRFVNRSPGSGFARAFRAWLWGEL
jgi:hypothetical protein